MATPRAEGDDQPVRVIGRYEFVSEIAPGALGELWKARIASGPEQGRIVSIRRVPRTATFDAQAVERLTNAGFAAMEVRHPKIAAVLDVVVGDSEIALVSEHIPGALLQSVLRPSSGKRPNVGADVATRIVLDVVEAVEAARTQWRGLFPSLETDDDRMLAAAVHGGLMPDSVLLASFGEAMLLDAGLAGIAMTMHAILEHAEVIAYRAPEQLDRSGPADERADVFTVGVFLWELLAARPLFAPAMLPRPPSTGQAVKTKAFSDAMQVATVRRKVLTASIQRLDSLPLLRGRVTKEFADIVARCLERDPERRFQSLAEVVARIDALGPRAVAPYDAVSRFLASTGATADVEEAGTVPSSTRTTSNRPTVPPEKKAAATADVQSIPPSSDVESLPPSTDVESLPPSGRAMAPTGTPSDFGSLDVESIPPSGPSTTPSTTPDVAVPFASALAPPLGASLARPEETTSAPVVRPVSDDGAPDLSSTLMSSGSPAAKNRKVVVGVVAGGALLALLGIIRVVTSGRSNETEAPIVSAASSATPIPPASNPPPPVAESATPAEVLPPAPETATERTGAALPSPTSSPAPAPGGPAPALPTKRQQPAKKKPYRPSAI